MTSAEHAALAADTRLKTAWAHVTGVMLAALALVGAAWAGTMAPDAIWLMEGAVALATTVLGFQVMHHSATRAAAADRMIELSALASPRDPRALAIVARRRRKLQAHRYRLSLASSVRRGARTPGRLSPNPPNATVLRHHPSLAEQIAAALERHDADERLVIEVARLLSSGGPDWERFRRIERLAA